jgi:hypothetical protein
MSDVWGREASSPGAREPISIAIQFDLLRKKEALTQKANVDMTMMDMVRIRGLPCVRRPKPLHKE